MKAKLKKTLIGKGTKIYEPSNIYGCVIGENCKVGAFVEIGPKSYIGNYVNIQSGVYIPEGIAIEDYCFIGPHVTFTNDKYPPSHGNWMLDKKTDNFNFKHIPLKIQYITWVEKGVSIGANVTVLPGIILGENSIIGAGAVVTKNIPNYSLVMGNPAKWKGWVCECGTRLNAYSCEYLGCPSCGKKYKYFKECGIIVEKDHS